jgi:short-subunit dehydrogenase
MARREIQGSRTLVTGASSGIGREIALQLARQGARLIVTARREDRLAELCDEIVASGGQAHSLAGDITCDELRRELMAAAGQHLGGLDILVNNAGIGAIGHFADADPQRLRRIMDVNFFAPVELIRVALPMLKTGRRPMIVNVSSVLGHRAVPKKSEYCASKFALHGFSDALRAELASQGIDLLLASPSTTESEFFDSVIENTADLPWLKAGSMPAAAVARQVVRAICRGKHEIILTPGGKLLVWFDRLLPTLTNRLVARFG